MWGRSKKSAVWNLEDGPHRNLEDGLHQNLTVLGPWSWIFSLQAMRNKFLLCRSYSVCDFFFLFNIIPNGLKQSLLDHVSVWFYDQITFHCMGAMFRLSIHQLMGIWVISTSWLSWIMLLSRRADSHWQWGTATTATDQPASASVLQSWGPGFLSTPSSSSSGACVQSFGSPSASLGPCWGRMTELQLILL